MQARVEGGGLAFPSSRVVDLDTSIREYTAPVDGWLGVGATILNASANYPGCVRLYIGDVEIGRQLLTTYLYSYGGCFLPMPKNSRVVFDVESGVVINFIKFTYAEGSKNEE